MKRRLFLITACVFLAFLLCFCASSSNQQTMSKGSSRQIKFSKEFMALLDNVNEEHKKIEKPVTDVNTILEKYDRDSSKYDYKQQKIDDVVQDGMLTAAQAKNDVNQLFYYLQVEYGLYQHFGGDEVFEPVRQGILNECDKAGKLTNDEFKTLLLDNLSFVKDCHFSIESNLVCATTFPCYCKVIDFEKTDGGYQTVNDKKKVAYVEGYDDLDSLFYPSISYDGDIVYYPVIFVDYILRYDHTYDNSKIFSLTIHFEDGTVQELAVKPSILRGNFAGATVEMHENQSIPVLVIKKMGYDEKGDKDAQRFLDYAEQLKDEPVIIIDLRNNMGGNGSLPCKWLQIYTAEAVPTNYYYIRYGEQYRGVKYKFENPRSISKSLTLGFEQPDHFIENKNLIIVLTGKNGGSAAETFVDLLHNVNNVLVVGDLTAGCLRGDGMFQEDAYKLTNSHMAVCFGPSLHVFPDEDYFKEGRGFKPDLWVSADDAEELAIKLIKKNIVK